MATVPTADRTGCLASPHLCGFPDATNTGVPAGTALQPSGSITVDTPGTVIDSLDVTGEIVVHASNVVIKRTRVRSSAAWPIQVGNGSTGVLIEDTEVDGLNSGGTVGIGWSGFTALRVDVHGSEDGIRASSNVVVQDSYIHGQSQCGSCHSDPVQSTDGSNIVIRHSSLLNPHNGNSIFLFKSDLGQINDVVVDSNLLNGGNYTVEVFNGGYGSPSNVTVTNNRFGHDSVYGPVSTDGAAISEAGNIWDDTLAGLRLS